MSDDEAGRGTRSSWFGTVLGGLVKLIAFAVMLAIPLLGVWSASSLAAYSNGPLWLAILCGALAFPVLPLAWDLWRERVRARRERESKQPPSPRILTFVDRMILRTIVLDGLFLALLFGLWPQAIFTALSTRGDWFLDGVEGADGARRAVLSIADGMEWLYEAAHENPYASEEESGDDDEEVVAGTVTTDGTRACRPPTRRWWTPARASRSTGTQARRRMRARARALARGWAPTRARARARARARGPGRRRCRRRSLTGRWRKSCTRRSPR
jgi:hypothetical protein